MKRKGWFIGLLCIVLTLACTAFAACEDKEDCSAGHSYGEWVVDTPATCTTDGERSRTCSVCAHKETEVIPAGHAYDGNVVCTACGYTPYTQGLAFHQSLGENFYTVTGLGTVTDEEIIIPNIYRGVSVGSIGWQAFRNCTGLTSVTIPDSIMYIPDEAFKGCSNLRRIDVDENNQSFSSQDGILYNKDKTEFVHIPQAVSGAVTIPQGITSIAAGAFEGRCSLESIAFAENSLVTRIAGRVFYGCESLRDVTLPQGVTSIEFMAFENCGSLEGIVIPSGVTRIEWKAFSGCDSLKSITLPFVGASKDGTSNTYFGYIFGAYSYGDNETDVPSTLKTVTITGGTSIEESAFFNCSSLTSITIPNSVTSIGFGAFTGCSSLTSITIPDSVTSIGSSTFSGCSSLTSVTISDSVTSIKSLAFKNCSSLASVTVPDSVTSIGYGAFSGCDSLESITLPFVGANKDETGNTDFAYPFYASSYTPAGTDVPSSLKTVVITGGTSITSAAFHDCGGLEDLTIPNSVTSIAYGALEGCSGLKSITLPFVGESKDGTSNTHFGYPFYASSYTDNGTRVPTTLKTVTVTADTSIDNNAFYGCASITSITIGGGVLYIGSNAFSGCENLTSVTLNSGLASIRSGAFENCSSLESLRIPDSVTQIVMPPIGTNAFSGCNSLKSIEVDEGNQNFSSQDGILYDKAKTVFLLVPKAVSGEVTIPDSITSIQESAFSGCGSLTSIEIPQSVTSIGRSAFRNCNSLHEISLPFVGASKDGTSNTHFGYIFGAYSYGDNETDVPSSLKTVIITAGTSIGNYAFKGCWHIENVTIADSVTSIGVGAFEGCDLKSITLPFVGTRKEESLSFGSIFDGNANLPSSLKAVTITGGTIGDFVFKGCRHITSITLGSGVTSIGDEAFKGCSSLIRVTIPQSVTSIGWAAFDGCGELTTINYDGTQEQWGAISKGSTWDANTGNYVINCTDGAIHKFGN